MKSSSLLSFLRTTLRFLECTSAIFAVLLLAIGLIVAPYLVSTPGLTFTMPIYQLQFEPKPPLQPIAYHGAAGGTVALLNVRGDLMVQMAANPGPLLNFVRLRTMSKCLSLILACAIFSLLRQLFDNVKLGEAFSLRSVQLIRRIGWCCVGYAAAASLVSSALDWLIASDLRQNLAIGKLQTDFIAAPATNGFDFLFGRHHLSLDLNTLGIALLAFVLAEVFRQGVLLKQDHDLTV